MADADIRRNTLLLIGIYTQCAEGGVWENGNVTHFADQIGNDRSKKAEQGNVPVLSLVVNLWVHAMWQTLAFQACDKICRSHCSHFVAGLVTGACDVRSDDNVIER